jgi:hypothetical protein
MRRTTSIIAICALAAATLIGAAIALGSGGELSKPETISVEARGGKFAFINGPNPNSFYASQGVIRAPVFSGATRVGRADAECTFFDKPGIQAECTITTFLDDGSIVVHGMIHFNKADHTRGAILGGTGRFRNARGQVVFVNSTGDTEGFIFRLEP